MIKLYLQERSGNMLTLSKTLFAIGFGFIFSAFLGLILVPFLKKKKLSQTINRLVPEHASKAQTPTFGGFIFLVPVVFVMIVFLLTNKVSYSTNLLIIMLVMISYGIIGFLDDYLSFKKQNNKGLKRSQKFILQILIAIMFYILYLHFGTGTTTFEVTLLGIKWDLSLFYSLFILLLLVGTTNAVNISDGLDGLAGGLSAIAFAAYGVISWGSKYIEGNQDIAIFCFVMVGALIGFLLYNTHKAKVFMGDTGSLSLGAALATVAILTHHEISLGIIGGVFVIETLSAILQIISVKYFKKKVFLMAPLHHHFQRLGWEETDIVKLFWAGGFILALVALIYGVWI